MRKLSLIFALLLVTLASAQTKTPVLVELFTSEGCSSCPPADQLLVQLEQKQPVVGADVIVLGEHVDYWDRDGWKDRFSSAQFTSRQENYANQFGISGPYTPQMVVNGRVEFVGNDSAKALRAIAQQARPAGTSPQIQLARIGDYLHVAITGVRANGLNVFCAITEGELSTRVGGGENKGHELHHTAVVRQLAKLGSTREGRFESDFPLKLPSDWRSENLRAVVFLQRGNGEEVFSATQVSLALK